MPDENDLGKAEKRAKKSSKKEDCEDVDEVKSFSARYRRSMIEKETYRRMRKLRPEILKKETRSVFGEPIKENETTYRRLPAEFQVDENNTVKIASYINNLDPKVNHRPDLFTNSPTQRHSKLYHIMEDLFSQMVPTIHRAINRSSITFMNDPSGLGYETPQTPVMSDEEEVEYDYSSPDWTSDEEGERKFTEKPKPKRLSPVQPKKIKRKVETDEMEVEMEIDVTEGEIDGDLYKPLVKEEPMEVQVENPKLRKKRERLSKMSEEQKLKREARSREKREESFRALQKQLEKVKKQREKEFASRLEEFKKKYRLKNRNFQVT